MITTLRERTAEVEQKQTMAVDKEQQLVEEGERITYEKKEAEEALKEAEPALAAAALALQNLRKEDIAEIKSMPNPPVAVLAVIQCVLELKPGGGEDPSKGWTAAKIMMSDPNFLLKLKSIAPCSSTQIGQTDEKLVFSHFAHSKNVSGPTRCQSSRKL